MSQTATREALTAVGAAAVVPKVIDKTLLDLQRRYAPVIASIPRIPWTTDIYTFAQRASRPSGGQVVDGGARPMTNSVYEQREFRMVHAQIIGGVTGYAAAVTSGQLPNLLGAEIEAALQGHYWDLETMAIWGSAPATLNGAAPQFSGFDNLLGNFSGQGQNAFDVNAGLSLGVLDKLADTVQRNVAMSPFGTDYMFVCSTTAESRIAQLLVAQQRFDQVEVAAGLLVPTYRRIPIVASSFLSSASFQMGTVTGSTATSGGSLPAASAYRYQVAAVIARSGETLPCAELTVTTGGSGTTHSNTLSFTAPTGLDAAGPILYKVYRSPAGGTSADVSLLGVVDAQVGVAADGITPVMTTSIVDTGTALVPKNGSTQPAVTPLEYYNGNANKKPASAGQEPIFLVPRNRDFLCRPTVREAARLDVATTVAAPDTLPFAFQTDTTLAVRFPRAIGAAYRVGTGLNITP